MQVPKKRPRKPSEGLVREPPTQYQAARRVSATEAARNFSEILNRVRYRGERFLIERGGVTIGELRPAAPVSFTGKDFQSLMRSLPPVDEEYLTVVEEIARRQPQLPESPWER